MRKKKYSKERFYKKLEAQALSDPLFFIKFKLVLGSLSNATTRMSKELDVLVSQNKLVLKKMYFINSKITWHQIFTRIKTMERVDRIIKNKPAF